MSKENLQNDILDFALNNVKSKIPMTFTEYGAFGVDRTEDIAREKAVGKDKDGDFVKLGNIMEGNGAISDTLDVSADMRNGSRATAFATSVLSSLFMADKICEGIDDFYADPKNKALFEGMSATEQEKLRGELKDKVRSDLAVKPKTEAGKRLAEKLTEEYTKADHLKSSKEQAMKFKESDGIDVYQMSTDMYGEGLAAIYAFNKHLSQTKSISDSAKNIRANAPQKNTGFYKHILDSIENDSAELAGEEEIFTHAIKQFSVDVNNNFNVTPTEFLKHYEKGEVTPEDNGWAMNLVGKMGLEYSDFKDLKVNGKPMFEGYQLHKEDEINRAVDVVAAVLSSKKVTLQKGNEETLLNPDIQGELKEPEKKSMGIIDTLIQLIKRLVGRDSSLNAFEKDKNDLKQMKVNATLERREYKAEQRQRVSFAELSGLNTTKKLNTPTEKQNTLSAEKKGVSRGK